MSTGTFVLPMIPAFKEFRDFRVYRPWDEALPGDTDPAEAWQARLQSIQERQARQHRGTHRGVQR
jgi:hypothetical protein